MIWNVNNDKKGVEYFGSIKIQKTQKNLVVSFDDIFIRKESFNWNHKGTNLGKHIIKKMNDFQTEELIFQNVAYSHYDISQSDFLLSTIWRILFDEQILLS